MKISAKEENGLLAIAGLAKYDNGPDFPVSLSTIANDQQISLEYLEKIFPALRKAGLVHSVRGANGGYTLTRPPEQITVAEVLRALNGEVLTINCAGHKAGDTCTGISPCLARPVWNVLQKRVAETLSSITLADLLERPYHGVRLEL